MFDYLQIEVGNIIWLVYGSDLWFIGFQGKIDDVKVYDRVFIQEELVLFYNSVGVFVVFVFLGFLLFIMFFFLCRKKVQLCVQNVLFFFVFVKVCYNGDCMGNVVFVCVICFQVVFYCINIIFFYGIFKCEDCID